MGKHLTPRNPILIVDDEQSALDGFEIALHSSGFNNVITCRDSRRVLPLLEKNRADLVLLDLIMPYLSGRQLIEKIKKRYPTLPIIVITAVNEVDSVVSCIKKGAVDYILKPVAKDQLKAQVKKALEVVELENENARLKKGILKGSLNHPDAFAQIVTAAPQMFSIFRYCEAVALSSKPILITGETGTGKELMARAIHDLSRRPGEFVAVNIAAFDDNVFADTLFGHIRGAFTGADKTRKGLVEKASGGTLFLDEIGDLTPSSQVKLLRLLQEEEYTPVGSDRIKHSKIRVLASTHRDLAALKSKGLFREDLYYRLFTHHIDLPPLRKRNGDIKLLLDHFLDLESKELGRRRPSYHPEMITMLSSYKFPGNIRELKAVVGDALIKHTSRMLSSKAFQEYICAAPRETPEGPLQKFPSLDTLTFDPDFLPGLKEAQDQVAAKLIHAAMKKTGENQTVAARLLGISQQSLSVKLKRLKTQTGGQ